MRFIVLGSGTILPDPARGCAGFAVTAGHRSWWIDGGSGTLQRSARSGVDPLDLAGGIYSHRHPDHCGELASLLFAMRVGGREAPYPLHAGVGMASHVAALRGVWGRWIDVPTPVHELPLDQVSTVDLGGLVLRTAPAAHSAGALHLRLEADGAAVVFSGDTGPSPHLATLAAGCDLLVCECGSSETDPIPGHLSATQVADVVRRAQPREVWLTHLYPHVDAEEALATVASAGVPVRRAEDGDVWTSDAPR